MPTLSASGQAIGRGHGGIVPNKPGSLHSGLSSLPQAQMQTAAASLSSLSSLSSDILTTFRGISPPTVL